MPLKISTFLKSVSAGVLPVLLLTGCSTSSKLVVDQGMRSWAGHENRGYDLFLQGQPADAMRELAIAFKEAQSKALGEAVEAQSLSDLAEVSLSTRGTAEASQLYEQAAQLYKQADNKQSPSVWRFEAALADGAIAKLLNQDGKKSDALDQYKRALELLPEKSGELESLSNEVRLSISKPYAELLSATGHAREAEAARGRTGSAPAESGTDEISLSASSFGNQLSEKISRSASAWEKGDRNLSRSICMSAAQYAETLPPNSPELSNNLKLLADMCLTNAIYPHAERFYIQLLTVQQHTSGVKQSDLLHSLRCLAEACFYQNRFGQAATAWAAELKLLKSDPNPDKARILLVEERLALAYNLQGKLGEAIPYYELALSERKKEKPENPAQLEVDLFSLADCYGYSNKLKEAEAPYKQVLAMREKKYGSQSPQVAEVLDRLGNVYAKESRSDDARATEERAFKTATVHIRENDPRLAEWLLKLANVYSRLGDRDKAMPLYERALPMLEPPATFQPVVVDQLKLAAAFLRRAAQPELARRCLALVDASQQRQH